uniref:Reverse transcriptase domain-containing protein n=1 Tax=Meloidogyne incognita TaxID=6306 RepID=A0A914MN57_MELIC
MQKKEDGNPAIGLDCLWRCSNSEIGDSLIGSPRFQCTLFNARSLKNKLSEFSFLLQTKKFDILLITETWLSNLVPNSLICPSSDYNVFRTDRNKNGGGVAILTKSFFQVNKLEIKKTPQINIAGIDILLNNNNKIRILNVYLPPKTKSDNVLEFIFILYDLVSIDYPVLITGDLNFVNIDWNSKLNNKLDLSEKYFLEFIENTKLTQLIKFPTRLNNTLDLILSSTPEIIPDIFAGPPFSTSDHNQICFSLSVPFSFSNSFNKLKTIYSKGNYSAMEFIFSNIDWKIQFSYIQNYNINSIYNCFKELVLYIAESYIPKEYISSVNLPPHIQKIQCYKEQLWKNIHYPNVYEKFLSVSAKLRYEQKKFFRNKEKKLLKNNSQKNIFNYISSQIKSKSNTIPTLINNTEILSNNEQKTNSFASYFYSTFTQFENHFPNIKELSSSTIEYIDIEEVEVYHLLSQLSLKANTSPDYINNYLLKKCAGSLTLPITQLFRYSLMTGELPEVWKQSLVKPLLKKGDPRNITNYRPISLTCSLCKILEKIIHSKLLTFFVTNNILPESQHGFLKTKSVTTNLLEAHSDWTNALDSKINVDIVYFDFAKAFDKNI